MTDLADPVVPTSPALARALSVDRLLLLADAMPQLVWTADDAGTIDYYNSRVSEYDGIRQVDGTWRWEPIVHPDDVPATMGAWQAAVAAGVPYEHEHRLRMADGSYRWHLSRAVAAQDPARGDAVWIGTATDIHELKSIQAELLDRDERLRIALRAAEQSHDAIVVWDTERGIVFWNRGAEELYG